MTQEEILKRRPWLRLGQSGWRSVHLAKVGGVMTPVPSDLKALKTKEEWMDADREVVGAFRRAFLLNALLARKELVRDFTGAVRSTMEVEHEPVDQLEDGTHQLHPDGPIFTVRSVPLPITHMDLPNKSNHAEWLDQVAAAANAVCRLVELTLRAAVAKVEDEELRPGNFRLIVGLNPTIIQHEISAGVTGFKVLCIIVPDVIEQVDYPVTVKKK